MKLTLLIGVAIVPLAVIAATPATTTTGPIPGNGQSQMVGTSGIDGALAARFRGAKPAKVSKQDLRRRANSLRPRSNTIRPLYDI